MPNAAPDIDTTLLGTPPPAKRPRTHQTSTPSTSYARQLSYAINEEALEDDIGSFGGDDDGAESEYNPNTSFLDYGERDQLDNDAFDVSQETSSFT